MGVLDRFEHRLDRLVNGAFARAFKAEVQPVEIASALQRECDDKAAIVGRGRTIVPNTFHVELSQRDYERLSVYSEPLAKELGDLVKEHAGEQGYAVVGPIAIELGLGDDLETGMFRVSSQAVRGDTSEQSLLPSAMLEVKGSTIPLTKDLSVLGRGSEADVQIDDPGVSRRHATLQLLPSPMITDLGSTNGTVVDGVKVTEAELHDGSVLTFGSTRVVFRYGG
ncbi:MAG: DUF3662 and FHA domain-containing protein [Candidatus Nanopelagicales bacterium]